MAACIVDELFTSDGPVEVGYDGPQRVTREVVAEPLPPSDAPSGGGDLRSVLTPDAVVLLTGGGRGITAEVATALARGWRCRIELAGRTPRPEGPEDAAVAAAPDRPALRKVLLGTGAFDTPRAIEAECSRLLAERALRATLSTLAEAGSEVTYHQVDVRDPEALAAVVADIEDRYGRLDLVVHGAGVLDDHLMRDKTAEGFDRVFGTKVDAARTLLAATSEATTIVFFGSVSGVFGNRGQVDYGAANDALDELATVANLSREGRAWSASTGARGRAPAWSPRSWSASTSTGASAWSPAKRA